MSTICQSPSSRGSEHQPCSVYYLPRPVSANDLEVMRRLDRLHLQFPFAGSRMLRGLLAAEGARSAAARENADEADG